jgi:hypothetical protein
MVIRPGTGWRRVSSDRTNSKSASRSNKDPARYANFFQIGHNAFEVLIEFGQQESIHTRIYLSPQHAQILSNLLLETLQQHKQLFGGAPFLLDKQQDKPH